MALTQVKKLAIPVAGVSLFLGACATSTPYQQQSIASDVAGGYSSERISEDRFQVEFRGNEFTDRERVENYLLFRAAELTRENGYDWFRTVRANTDENVQQRLVREPFHTGRYGYFGPSWGYYGTGFGWRSWDPFLAPGPFLGGGIDVRTIERYRATATIEMGRGVAPDDPSIFRADRVIADLRPTIERPENMPR